MRGAEGHRVGAEHRAYRGSKLQDTRLWEGGRVRQAAGWPFGGQLRSGDQSLSLPSGRSRGFKSWLLVS